MSHVDPFAHHASSPSESSDHVPRANPAVAVRVVLAASGLVTAAVIAGFVVSRGGDDADSAMSDDGAAGVLAVMVDDEDYFVGTNIVAGAYQQAFATAHCEWLVSDPVAGDRIERGIPGSGIATVNLSTDTKFRSSGCGMWVVADG
jgi:hypothetical protein